MVPTPTDLVLHHLSIKGIADAPVLAGCCGLKEAAAHAAAQELVAAGLAIERTGRLSGFSLTPEGKVRRADLLTIDPLSARADELSGWYTRFEEVNGSFKQLCTDWQLVAGERPNDHSDAAYDSAVLERLGDLNTQIQVLLSEPDDERLNRYARRLGDAAGAVLAGDSRRLTAPLCDSYHDIWMELHHDLLTSFGLTRTAADA